MFLAIECGSTKKNAIIRYCAKTKDSAVSIVGPAWTAITETMPPDMRPEKGRNEYEWVFPKTGAKFVLFGTDAQSFAKGRGPRTDLQFFDECGFYQDLESVENALLPALQTTNGKALYLSTPSETLAHPYIQRIYAASASQRLQHATLYENSRINPELIIAGEASRLGMSVEDFKNSTYFKREFLAQLVQEESTAGFPSFTIESAKRLVQEFQMPKMYDGYVAIDVGLTNDPHAALFAVHDWESDKLLIVDEVELRSDASTLKTLSEALKEKEKFYFGTDRWNGTLLGLKDHYKVVNEAPFYLKDLIFQEAPKNPYLRCVDDSSGAAKELTVEYGYACTPALKHNKALAVDAANVLLASGRVVIHPRCRRFVEQLLSAQWNKKRTDWIHAPKHHFDLVSAWTYLTRSIVWNRASQLPRRSNMNWLIPSYEPRIPGQQTTEDLRKVFLNE